MGVLDPLAVHFLAIVTDFANQLQLLSQENSERKEFLQTLQISELNVRKSDFQDSVIVPVKSENMAVEDSLTDSLYNNCNNSPENQFSSRNSKFVKDSKDLTKNILCPKLKQKSLKTLYVKKSESQIKLDKKNMQPVGPPVLKETKNFKCNSCQSDFPSEPKLILHKSRCPKDISSTKGKTRNSKTYKCTFCNLVFTTRRTLMSHLNQAHKSENDPPTEDISNGSCTVSEDSVIEFSEETQLLPENLPFFCCQTCLLVYKTHKEFESHVCKNGSTAMEEGTILHNYIEMTGRHLITNMDILKALKKYKCGLCHEEYRSIPRMSYHLPRCTRGPYKCELCTEEYAFKKDLNLHKKKAHKGTNSFFCDECGLAFKFRTSLQKHKVNRHETDQGPYSCEECGKNFNKRIHLTNHKINTHRIERKFLCQMCGNKFSNYGSLMAHLDTHTGTRRFTCNYCNKTFRQKEKLKFHTRIHTGERPHLCQTCGKGFIRKSKLDEHIRRHRGEKRYHCSKCDKSYAAGWDLKLHNRKQHPQSSETESSSIPGNFLSKIKSEIESNNAEICTEEENKSKDSANAQLKNVKKNSMTTLKPGKSNKSKLLQIEPSNQDQETEIMQNNNLNSENSAILMQLNTTSQSASLTEDRNLENADSKILLQVTPDQNHSVLLNNGSNTNNSKIIVQLDSIQQSQPSTQISQPNNPNDSNSNKILVHLDPSQIQTSQSTLVQSGNGSTSSSRILLQLCPGQNQPLPPNTLLTVADAIHLAPVVEDVNNINLGNLTAQYVQLTTAQPEDSNSNVVNGSNVPLHIQLPVSSIQVPISTLSHGSGSNAFELKSLSVQGQTGLVFASTGFDVGNISY
ncbi:hypothetical protein L9F63_005614 [Diploptera punctata]|uniref:C2H2-type domain-containing protein n=1 Tax=Diploptera punctata TaxID=6984 RepID=A0AAD8E5A1_DIPPU|nr:hypothetical protein L9F63_005614 [Diploptera punctata]